MLFRSSVEQAINCLKDLQHTDLTITDDETYKAVYNLRTEVNKQIKAIASARKQMTATIIAPFVQPCMEIEKAGALIVEEMTERLNAYKPREKGTTTYKMTISTENKNAFEKVKTYALKYGCEIKEVMK